MAINIENERLITLDQARRRLPGKVSLPTLWRWRVKGIKGRRLESLEIGGKIFTSVEALGRFVQQRGEPAGATGRTSRKRQRNIEAAERELARAGI